MDFERFASEFVPKVRFDARHFAGNARLPAFGPPSSAHEADFQVVPEWQQRGLAARSISRAWLSSSLWGRLRRRPRQSREIRSQGCRVQVVAGTLRLLLPFPRLPTVKLVVVRHCTSEPRLLSAAPSLGGGGLEARPPRP